MSLQFVHHFPVCTHVSSQTCPLILGEDRDMPPSSLLLPPPHSGWVLQDTNLKLSYDEGLTVMPAVHTGQSFLTWLPSHIAWPSQSQNQSVSNLESIPHKHTLFYSPVVKIVSLCSLSAPFIPAKRWSAYLLWQKNRENTIADPILELDIQTKCAIWEALTV